MVITPAAAVRWVGRGVATLLAVVLTVIVVIHTPAVREMVRARLAAWASQQTGAAIDVGRLQYALDSLTFTADDVAVSQRALVGGDTPAMPRAIHYVFARRVVVQFGWRDLAQGRFAPRRVAASGLDIVLQAGETTVGLQQVSATIQADEAQRQVGRIGRDGPSALRIGTSSHPLTRLDASFLWNGTTFNLTAFRISMSAIDLDARGRIVDLTAPRPGVEATGTLRGSGRELCALSQLDSSLCSQVRQATLRGQFAVTGALASPVARLDVTGDGLGAGAIAPVSIAGTATVTAGRVDVPRADVKMLGGTVSVREMTLTTPTGRAVGQVTWKGIDGRRLATASGFTIPLASVLSGEARFDGNPQVPATFVVDARVTATSLPGEVPLDAGVTWYLELGRWSSSINGTLGTTKVGGRVSGRLPSNRARWSRVPIGGTLTVTSPDLQNTLRLSKRLGFVKEVPAAVDVWQGHATANVTLDGTVGAPLVGLVLQATAARPEDERSIDAQADLSVAAKTVAVHSLQVTRGTDRVSGAGRWDRRAGSIEGEFSGATDDIADLGVLAGVSTRPVGGAATFEGRVAGTTTHPQVHGVIHGTDVAVTVPGDGTATKDRTLPLGGVDVTLGVSDHLDLHVDAPDAHLNATATVGFTPEWLFSLAVQAEDWDAGVVSAILGGQPAIGGRVDGEIVASGSALKPGEVQAQIDLKRAEVTIDSVSVELVRPAHARIAAGRLLEADLEARAGELTVKLAREADTDAWHLALEGMLPTTVDGLPDPPAVTLDALVNERRITLRKGAVTSGEMTAQLSGQVPVAFLNQWLPASLQASEESDTSPAAVDLTVHAVPLGALARRFYPESAVTVDGTLDVALTATAARPELDAVQADGRIEHGRVVAAGITLEQQDAAPVAMADGSASISGWRWTGEGTDFTLRGESTVTGSPARFDAAAAGDLDLGVMLKLAADRVGGKAHFDVAARGGADGVTFTGDVAVRDAGWVARDRGIALTDTDAELSCDAERCVVEQFSGRLNGGTVSVEGELPLADLVAGSRLRMLVRGAGFEMPKGTRHDVDADLELAGTKTAGVTGTVTIWPGTVQNSIVSIATSVLSLRDSSSGDDGLSPEAKPSRLSQVPLDVRIVTGNDLSFDGHDLQLAASADLRLSGTLAAPRLRGRVAALDKGRIFFGGRMWDLEEGTVTLGAGADATETRLAATVSAKISKYAVRIAVSGPASEPSLAMTSDPPLGQSDLAELVLTGQISGNATGAGGQQVATMVSGELLTTAGRNVGIDSVRIEQNQSELSTVDLEPVSRLTISKRVTRNAEIVYSQGLSDPDDQAWVLVYRPPWRSLDMRATLRTNGAEAYEIRQELEFGPTGQRRTTTTQQRRVAPPISRIDIEGLSADETAAVRQVLKLEPGEGFTTAGWQRDRQAVTHYFHERDRLAARVRASYTPTDDGAYVLAYRITPGPLTRIEVHGYQPGGKTNEALRDAWSRTVVEELLSEDLTDLVRLKLAADRYYSAEVATTFRPLDGSGRLAVINVSTGARSSQHAIRFAGNANIPDATLEQVVEQRRLEPRCWIEPSVLEAPIVAAYRARGYLSARATSVRTVEDARAVLTVTVDEGRLFAVGTVALVGTTALGEEKARAGLNLAPGATFTADVIGNALSRLRTAYARASYLEADVVPTTSVVQDRGVVDVTFAVTEGPPSTLRAINVTGRRDTSEALVSRVLDVQPGGAADPVALDQGQQRLYRTGIFRTVDVDLEPVASAPADASPRPVEAKVALEERAGYRIRYGIQFGPSTIESITTATDTAEPGATFDLQRRNILGHGIVGGIGGVFSANQHRVRGTVSAPTWRGRFVSSTFTIEQANQDRDSNDGLTHVIDRSLHGVFEQRWRHGVERRLELAYGFEIDHRRVELHEAGETPLPLRGNLADLNTTVTFDSRDNRFNPHRGTFHTSRVEASAGAWVSDLPFTRYQAQHYVYLPAGRTTFASGIRFGTLATSERNNPTTLLLFFKTGGATSVRGYETDSLTPAYTLGVPVGGKVLLVLNEEMRRPVTRWLGFVTFVDIGNTFTGLNTFSFSDLKVGAGVGLRVDTPVAVLRFDVAAPLPQQPGGPRQRWYLSIGQAF